MSLKVVEHKLQALKTGFHMLLNVIIFNFPFRVLILIYNLAQGELASYKFRSEMWPVVTDS